MNIFVIGGAGYIGSHVVKLLIEAGYTPIVYDNLEEGHRVAVPKEVKLVKANLSDIRTIIHTAWEWHRKHPVCNQQHDAELNPSASSHAQP